MIDRTNNTVEFYVEAPDGSRSRVSLPDGSVVWLNSGSRLTYPETFDRKVTLEGPKRMTVRALPLQ